MSLVKDLQEILNNTHKDFIYISDAEKLNSAELWEQVTVSGRFTGDCEEFARRACILARDKGYRARLVLCGVYNPKGDHLVCEVEGYILDNRSPWVKHKDLVKYYWVSISGYNPGDPWHTIEED